MEDLAQGSGYVTQTRGATTVQLHKINVPQSYATVADMVGDTSLVVGQTVSIEDYATGNNSGVMLGTVVANDTGVADGGAYISLPNTISGPLQFKQNLPLVPNVKLWGAVGNSTDDDSTAILAADTYATAVNSVLVTAGIYRIAADITLVSNYQFVPGASLTIDSGITVTFNGSIDAGHHTLFRGPGSILIRDTVDPRYCSPFIDHIKERWFSANGAGARINEAIAAGGSKTVVLCPIGREMDWGSTTVDLGSPASQEKVHITIKGAGGMFGTEYVIPAGAGIIGIDLRSDTGAADEPFLQDFRLIEDSGSVVSTCIRGGGTSAIVKNVWLGNADKGWLVDRAIGGHIIENVWIESCNTCMEYTNDGSTSQGTLSNIQLFAQRDSGAALILGDTGGGSSRIKNLVFTNLNINGAETVAEDGDVNGIILGPRCDGIQFDNTVIRGCSGKALSVNASQTSDYRQISFGNLAIEDCVNASGDAYGLYFEAGEMSGFNISSLTHADVDIPLRVPTTLRGANIVDNTDDYIMGSNSVSFNKRVETGVFIDSTPTDVFTLDLGSPYGVVVEINYTLYDANENAMYNGVERFTTLFNATVHTSAIDTISGLTCGPESISVTPTLATAATSLTFRLSQNHSINNSCAGEFEVKLIQKGPGNTLGLAPTKFTWDI